MSAERSIHGLEKAVTDHGECAFLACLSKIPNFSTIPFKSLPSKIFAETKEKSRNGIINEMMGDL